MSHRAVRGRLSRRAGFWLLALVTLAPAALTGAWYLRGPAQAAEAGGALVPVRQLEPELALAVIASSGMLALALAALLLRHALSPLQAVTRVAQAVAAGDASARATVEGPLELQLLARAFNDMLDVKQAVETALVDSETRLRTLGELSSDWYWEQDAGLRFTAISDSIRDHVGFTRDQHLGHTRWELPSIGPDAAGWDAHRAQLARHEPFHDFEIVRPGADGQPRHVLVSGVPLFGPGGRFCGYRGVGRDITQERRAEQALALREQRQRELIEHLPVGVMVHEADGSMRQFNAEACRVLALPPAALQGLEPPPGWRLLDEDGQPLGVAGWPVSRVRTRLQPLQGLVLGVDGGDGQAPRWLLAHAFPELDAQGALESVVVALIDISAQRQAEALRQQREQAEAANRAKSEFVSRMSHELRTPLNAVMGFAEVLRNDPALRDQARALRQLGHIHRAGAQLLALVNDLLDIARIESTALSLQRELLALAPLLDECVALHGPAAAAASVTLEPQPLPPGLHVLADADRLRQVLHNLIGNAIKYNRAGGRVRLQARREAGWVLVDVDDTGLGLQPEQLARLFEPFNRLGAEHSGIEGTGLGLVIARQLAQAMGGDLTAHSEGGSGSRFTLQLPGAEAVAPRAHTNTDGAAGGGLPLAPPPRPHRLLCVEDDALGRELLRSAFDAWPGCQLDLAATTAEAEALALQRPPDLALLDLSLPDGDGVALLGRLRALPGLQRLPSIALTADASAAQRRRALDAGFDVFLGKPLQLAELLRESRRLLG